MQEHTEISRAHVTKLVIKGFRSLAAVSIDFGDITILVGRNGAGKTNVIDALNFLSDVAVVGIEAALKRRGGISLVRHKHPAVETDVNLGLRVEFQQTDTGTGVRWRGFYAFEVAPVPEDGEIRVLRETMRMTDGTNERYFDRAGEGPLDTDEGHFPMGTFGNRTLLIPMMSSGHYAWVHALFRDVRRYSIIPDRVRQFPSVASSGPLWEDGANAAHVLEDIQRHNKALWDQLCRHLAVVVPGTRKVSAVQVHQQHVALEFEQDWGQAKPVKLFADNMSDGTLRTLGLLLAIFQPSTASMIAIEEPEAMLHPAAVNALMAIMREAARHSQIVITTHSPELLDAEWIRPEHLRLVCHGHDRTIVTGVSDISAKEIREHLASAGEQLRTNALQPPDLFAPLNVRQLDLFAKVA